MKVGILTYHAAHNYGSALQAYALQQTIRSLGHDVEIIDFRPEVQRRIYRPFYRKGFRPLLKAFALPRLAIQDRRKWHRFERFIASHLNISEQMIRDPRQLPEAIAAGGYDAIVCGSDQIWNPAAIEFSEAWLLPTIPDQVRLIAYAPSMGPEPSATMTNEVAEMFHRRLQRFSRLSARERETADRLREITGRTIPTVLDPTMLIPAEHWHDLSQHSQPPRRPYILLYSPLNNLAAYKRAAEEAEWCDMDVVVTTADVTRPWIGNRRFRFVADAGPIEFLSLIRGATLVVTTSFHALIFARIFSRPALTVDADGDARISAIRHSMSVQSSIEFLRQSLSTD